jgi:hypothetical protein
LPWIAYSDLCGEKVEPITSNASQGSVRYIKILQDMQNCVFRYKKDYPAWAMSWREWLHETRSHRRSIVAEFHAGDVLIAFLTSGYALLSLSKIILGTIKVSLRLPKNIQPKKVDR